MNKDDAVSSRRVGPPKVREFDEEKALRMLKAVCPTHVRKYVALLKQADKRTWDLVYTAKRKIEELHKKNESLRLENEHLKEMLAQTLAAKDEKREE